MILMEKEQEETHFADYFVGLDYAPVAGNDTGIAASGLVLLAFQAQE
jgi:hypothetical protein